MIAFKSCRNLGNPIGIDSLYTEPLTIESWKLNILLTRPRVSTILILPERVSVFFFKLMSILFMCSREFFHGIKSISHKKNKALSKFMFVSSTSRFQATTEKQNSESRQLFYIGYDMRKRKYSNIFVSKLTLRQEKFQLVG